MGFNSDVWIKWAVVDEEWRRRDFGPWQLLLKSVSEDEIMEYFNIIKI